MKLGFTGTRQGMTERQKQTIVYLLDRLEPIEVHHGDCIGADAQFHALVARAEHYNLNRLDHIRVVIHPPINPEKRAWCKGDVVRPAHDYLARNRAIVNASDRLLAAPKSNSEELRSGTWSTIRYARKLRKPCTIIWPNGTLKTLGLAQLI